MPCWLLIKVRAVGHAAAAVLVALLFAAGGDAVAQEAALDSVQTRARPEYDPIGFELDRLFTDTRAAIAGQPTGDPEAARGPLSSFSVFPKLEVDVAHTDNLFRTSTNEQSDMIAVLRPSVRVASDWENHSLTVSARADVARHRRNVRENYEDRRIEAAGRISVDEFDNLDALASSEHGHEQRGTIDDPGLGFGPTFVDIYKLGAGYQRKVPDGILVHPYFGFARYRYDNNGAIDNSDRWRDEFEYRMRLGYEFEPGTTLFVQPRYTSLVYRRPFDRNGLTRDTQLLEFLAGVTWDASAVTFLEAGVGILGARFDDTQFTDTTKPTANLQLTWNATPLVTVKSSAARTFSPTATAGLAGTLATSFEGAVDWEARYNVILGIGFGYQVEEFIDAVPERTRTTARYEISGRWLVNEYFFVRSALSHEARTGDLLTDEIEENRLLVTAGAQL